MRLSVLRLLASSAVSSSPSEKEVVKRCLQGEDVSLDVQGVRERVLRIGRIGQVVPDGDQSAADVAARWLIGQSFVDLSRLDSDHIFLVQLKVNLRPLWPAASHALASLAERFGDLVWNLVFSDLQKLCRIDSEFKSILPGWISSEVEEGDGDDIHEEERTWRDPSAHKMRVAVAKWLNGDASRKDLIKVE